MVSRVLFAGNVAYADQLGAALQASPLDIRVMRVARPEILRTTAQRFRPDLIVVGGWRHLVPPDVLAIPTRGAVGFHSAKLPEYPGRAPVPWTLLRGDRWAWNTMLYLDEGIDSGDIIDTRARVILPGETPESLYRWIGSSSVAMLEAHLPALLDGTAPRTPQDPARRGPLTTKDGWQRWEASRG